MKIAAVNFQFPVNGAPEFVVRNHPADRAFDEQFGMARAAGAGVFCFVAADKSGEAHEALLFFFLAGKPHFFRVDHDDEIASIDVGGVDRLFFAAQKIGGLDRDRPSTWLLASIIHHLRGTSLAFAEKVFIGAEKARKLRARWVGVNWLFRGSSGSVKGSIRGASGRGWRPELLIITIMSRPFRSVCPVHACCPPCFCFG